MIMDIFSDLVLHIRFYKFQFQKIGKLEANAMSKQLNRTALTTENTVYWYFLSIFTCLEYCSTLLLYVSSTIIYSKEK